MKKTLKSFRSLQMALPKSDGLNYIDLRYQFTPSLKGEYYFGNLEDLYNKHYVD